MHDLAFEPAAKVFLEDLAGEEGYYVAQNLARIFECRAVAIYEVKPI